MISYLKNETFIEKHPSCPILTLCSKFSFIISAWIIATDTHRHTRKERKVLRIEVKRFWPFGVLIYSWCFSTFDLLYLVKDSIHESWNFSMDDFRWHPRVPLFAFHWKLFLYWSMKSSSSIQTSIASFMFFNGLIDIVSVASAAFK